jgi:predicted O-methyltransferase YrrM
VKVSTPLVIINYLSGKLHLNRFRVKLASSILGKKTRKCVELADYIDLSITAFRRAPLKYVGYPIAPLQIKQEIQKLLAILAERNIETMLEIGTASGGTLYLFAQIASSNAKIISLDLPSGSFGGYEEFKIPFFSSFAQKNQRIFLVKANSHSPSSLATVKSILKGRKLDFLFIDGDHTYEGVKRDFQMYSPLISKNGLIAFHDICLESESVEVHKFWNEIKHAYQYQEIINPSGLGIGILLCQ